MDNTNQKPTTAPSPGAAQAQAAPPPPGPNPAVMMRRAAAHWYVALILVFLGAGITAVVVKNRKLTYRSEVSIFYREGMQRNLIEAGGTDPLKQLGAKLKEMLLSQTILKQVIDECGINQDIVKKRGYNDAIEALRKKIDFKAKTTDTFAITYDGTSREDAQLVTQKLADTLIQETSRVREEQVKSATEFLDTEKKRLEDELSTSDKAIAAFVADHPEYATEANTRPGLQVRAEQKNLTDAQKRDAAAQRDRQKQDRIDQQIANGAPASGGPLPKPKSGAPAPAAAAEIDPELLNAKKNAQAELAKAQKEYDDLVAKGYTDDYPDVKVAAQKKARASESLHQAEAAIAAATPPPPPPVAEAPTGDDPYSDKPRLAPRAAATVDKESEVKKAQEKSKSSQKMVEIEAEWQRLMRENEAAQKRVSDLEQKRFKAEMQASATLGGFSAQIAVLDPAYKPTGPVSMPNSMAAIVGMVASIFVGLAGAAARGIVLDDRIFDPSDIEGLELGPVLAVVPKVKKRPWWRRG